MKTIFYAVVLAASLWAQNETPLYPNGIINDVSLPVAKDRAETTLASAINSSVTTFTVTSGSLFPTAPAFLVTIDSEQIRVCGNSANTFTVCDGGRGYNGTSAASHSSLRPVRMNYTQKHFNQVAAELKEIEKDIADNRAYNWTRVNGSFISGDLSSPGANTLTFSVLCPEGVAGANTNHPVRISGGSVTVTKTISGATNATPIEVTTTTSHGFTTGNFIVISGVAGNTAANGWWDITVTSATKFTLNTSVGNGSYTSGGSAVRDWEAANITGGTCTSGLITGGTINLTTKNPHTGAYVASSATAGVMEAGYAQIAAGNPVPRVHIGRGRHILYAPISARWSHYGDGQTLSILSTEYNGPIITYDTGPGEGYYLTNRHFAIEASGQLTSASIGINFTGSNAIRRGAVEFVHIRGPYYGIKLQTTGVCDGMAIHDNILDNANLNQIYYGIYRACDGAGTDIIRNRLIGVLKEGITYINNGAGDTNIIGNEILGSNGDYGIRVECPDCVFSGSPIGVSGGYGQRNNIIGNQTDSFTKGIRLRGISFSQVVVNSGADDPNQLDFDNCYEIRYETNASRTLVFMGRTVGQYGPIYDSLVLHDTDSEIKTGYPGTNLSNTRAGISQADTATICNGIGQASDGNLQTCWNYDVVQANAYARIGTYNSGNPLVIGGSFIEMSAGGSARARFPAAGGIQILTGTRPACDSTSRGTVFRVDGGAGVADTAEVCRKDAADAYAWVSVY